MNKTEREQLFDNFDWDEYFRKLDENPEGNQHAGCDHAYDYCCVTTDNRFAR